MEEESCRFHFEVMWSLSHRLRGALECSGVAQIPRQVF